MEYRYLQEILRLIEKLQKLQGESLEKAVRICADSIKRKRMINIFGAGHSALPGMEAFPRIGSFVGFHQITEPYLGFNGFVVGKGGQRQMSYIEQTPGLAEVIFENYRFTGDDSLIIFSHSGINALPVEMAEEAHARGMSTIGVVSVEHARRQAPKAPSGKKLHEICTCVIDTGAPPDDAAVELSTGEKSGGTSTVLGMVIMNIIVTETAQRLIDENGPVLIYPSHNVTEGITEIEKRENRIFEAYKEMIAKL
jgi:uncharacterized phosphosugar-binding protein